MLKKAVLVLIIAVLGVVGLAASRPDSFSVSRTIDIKAPPAVIYAKLEHFPSWSSWSPYEKLDPGMKKTYSGADRGVGAVYEWVGNGNAGSGRMEIKAVQPARKLTIQLDFTAPFEAHNTAEFTLVPKGDLTTVIWAIRGPSPFMSKLFGLFLDMDALIGKDFESGLASLKQQSEAAP